MTVKFYKAKVRKKSDTAELDAETTVNCILIKFADGTFAIQKKKCEIKAGPYILKDGEPEEYTITRARRPPVIAMFQKCVKAPVQLPDTCIESAEHVIKCIFANTHEVQCIPNGMGAVVSMSIGQDSSFDIDGEMDVEVNEDGECKKLKKPVGMDLPTVAYLKFRLKKLTASKDANRENFAPGEGMILVYTKNPKDRPDGWWSVHAVAVLIKSKDREDPFMVVSEVFADRNKKDSDPVEMVNGWNLNYFRNAMDFKESYQRVMPRNSYTLWKLSASKRES
ncbi:MAG TPA: hypothetical protein VME63_08640 [Dyella sp.]|uniref:hypothetical protein n=1 Tax=Dyella sp. TaxID=1869338 RepID=UPI002D0874F2|nr:hypothetical protein [Dyella sp.]HTV85460.1 hypothetical protein [Dyella sp.]